MMTHTYTLMPMLSLDCLHTHISSSRLQKRFYRTYAAIHVTCVFISPVCYDLFYQCVTIVAHDECATSRIADCTVRHLCVEHPFSSSDHDFITYNNEYKAIFDQRPCINFYVRIKQIPTGAQNLNIVRSAVLEQNLNYFTNRS